MAFEQVLDQGSQNHYVDLINIGQEIVKICANVPLAIRVIGRLLYGQEKSKWLTIQELGIANLRENRNGIKPILKLSYHNLESSLKSCFSHCSLYPKDSQIEKELMISLWMAQGYIVPLEKGQSIEDAGVEYFSILLRRCFFQDVQKDEYGEISTFKLHDLMHDVALEVAEKEICLASTSTSDVDKMVRHVSLMKKSYANDCSSMAHIRTFLYVGPPNTKAVVIDIELLLSKFRCLRTLDFSFLNIKILPASIGKLFHLRYLNLSNNDSLVELPKSITKLCNLQTLNLDYCKSLKELPKDLGKLVNLRVLGLDQCTSLVGMPLGINKLTGLYKLSKFVVRNSSLEQLVELESLKTLKKLRGTIEIVFHFSRDNAFVKDHIVRDGAYIRDKEHLHTITFEFKHEDSDEKAADYEEELLGALQQHANLKALNFVMYHGVRMPRWAEGDNLAAFLPKLVRLEFWRCSELHCLSSLGKLRCLKFLALSRLPNLEYIESYSAKASLLGSGVPFLPCLETLVLSRLPKLKEWWRPTGEMVRDDNSIGSNKESHQSSLFFSELKLLQVLDCPDLISLPNCPELRRLYLSEFNERLRMTIPPTSPKLMEVSIDNVAWLHYSLPIESFQSLTSLHLHGNNDVKV
ncbi:disease resistance protein RGA2-like [Silene latifolia]|uniref:disease resistance protein RGA2-like n=1 Tax=Silene latifolia TaxID=37657 RepID=UPI003D78597F